MEEEKTPLLSLDPSPGGGAGGKYGLVQEEMVSTPGGEGRTRTRTITSSMRIAKHITLPQAIGIMVGTVAGTGIFISPTGVTKQVGSVGTTLLMWMFNGLFSLVLAMCYAELGTALPIARGEHAYIDYVMGRLPAFLCLWLMVVGSVGTTLLMWMFNGLFSLVLAMCYAELGTALPIAGGDYAYIDYVMGRLPAFLCLWLMVVLIGPCALCLSGRTVATYLTTLLGMDCYQSIGILISLWIVVGAAALNCRSVKWTAWLVTIFSVGKVLAMGVIVVAGIVRLGQGYTQNLEDPFAYSSTDPGAIMLGFLPAFVTFAGWDCVNALAEEMVNPKRDIPIATAVSLLLVTGIYLLINVAYFTALTPAEFAETDAVAFIFAARVMPGFAFLIPVFVIISAAGSNLNLFLACPRWAFAGGRDKAIPEVFSYIHVRHLTPVVSILFTALMTCLLCLAVFFDIQDLLNITSIITQIKIILALIALLILKRREPNKPSTVSVHFLLVIITLIILTVFTVLPLWQTPKVALTAFGIFILGFPLYYIKEYMGTWPSCISTIGAITKTLQLLCQVVPPAKKVT